MTRAGHTRQFSRQSDTVLRPNICLPVTLPPNMVSKLRSDSEQRTFFAHFSVPCSYCRVVACLDVKKLSQAQLYSWHKKTAYLNPSMAWRLVFLWPLVKTPRCDLSVPFCRFVFWWSEHAASVHWGRCSQLSGRWAPQLIEQDDHWATFSLMGFHLCY